MKFYISQKNCHINFNLNRYLYISQSTKSKFYFKKVDYIYNLVSIQDESDKKIIIFFFENLDIKRRYLLSKLEYVRGYILVTLRNILVFYHQ